MSHEATLANAAEGSGPNTDFSGHWVNELGSVVELRQQNNTLSGKYVSQVSGTGGKTIGDLQGYVDGDLIAFVVRWRDFQAITSWVGQLDQLQTRMNTLWQMTKQVSPGDEWESINAGADSFTKMV